MYVFIHGGAFEQWYGASNPIYNGTQFSMHDVITVTFNYRLGALGFLSTDTLNGEYGFLDQRLALKWVRDNIHAFGGDPSRVTIGGESAGAESVGAHMISPGSQHLFRYAIMESNPLGSAFNTKESALAVAEIIFQEVGCAITDDQCIRAAPVDGILEAYLKIPTTLQGNPFSPVVGPGNAIPMQPYIGLRNGMYPSTIKLLTGFNRDEGVSFIYSIFTSSLNQTEYTSELDQIFGSAAASTIEFFYPFTTPPIQDGRVLLADIFMDVGFSCPILSSALGAITANPEFEIFVYEFDHVTRKPLPYRDTVYVPYCAGKVCHSDELYFVFDVFGAGAFGYEPIGDERLLARRVNRAWANFIKHGDPNVGIDLKTLQFPKLGASLEYLHIVAANSSTIGPFSRSAACALWDASGLFPGP